MPEISQKLTFSAAGVATKLEQISGAMDKATGSLQRLNSAANQSGGGFAKTRKELDRTKKKAGELTVSWKTMARIITTQITVRAFAGLISSMQEAVTSARELGLALAEIKTIADDLPVDNLSNDVLELSNYLGQSADSVAEGVYQTLSNQVVDATDSMDLYRKAADLANVTNADSADTVNAVSSVMNSYNLEMEEADRVMDVLFNTIKVGRVRMSELANSVGRVTPLASQMGVTVEEASAALAVMTRQGVSTSTAVTQLRAILNKLLRPSQAMLDLYRKWGVETGPQAIQKFGGLEGLLKAITKETGGSAKQIGELLQRVRSVTGFMAAATDGGETYAEVLAQISENAGSAQEAIDQFRSSDAFQNQQAVNELKNAWTEIGQALIPFATGAAYGFTGAMELLQGVIKAATFGMVDFNVELDKIYPGLEELIYGTDELAKRQEAAEEVARRVAEAYGKDQKEAFEAAEKAYANYVSEVRVGEREVRKEFERGLDIANERFEAAADNIVDHYKDSVKRLKDFLNDAKDAVKDNFEDIQDLQDEIQERRLEGRLDRAGSYVAKENILQQELAKAQREAAQALGQVGASDESKQRALDAQDRVVALAEEIKTLRERNDVISNGREIERTIERALEGKIKANQRNTQAIERGAVAAEKELAAREKDTAEVEELSKKYQELLDERARAQDPVDIARIEKELVQVGERLFNKLGEDAAEAMTSGFDRAFADVSQGFQEAFAKATFDWVSVVDGLRDELARREFEIKVKLGLDGEGERLAEEVAGPRLPGETLSDYALRAQKEANKLQSENIDAERNRRSDDILRQAALDEVNRSIAEGNRLLDTQASGIAKSADGWQQLVDGARSLEVIGGLFGERLSQEERRAVLAEKIKTAMGDQLEFQRKLNELGARSAEGGAITNEDITELEELRQRAEDDFTSAQAKNAKQAVDNIRRLQEAQRDYIKSESEVSNQLPAAQQLIDKINARVEAENKVKTATDGSRQNLQSSQTPAQQIGDAMTRAGTGSIQTGNGAQTAAAVLPGAASAAGTLAANLERAAAAAERVAAAGGGAATAYYGGATSKYFASGGVAGRGQDTVPALLSRGEMVISKKNTGRFFSELNAINQGAEPVFREQGGPVTNVGDVNVTVQGGDSSQQTVREIGHALRREIQRGNIKLR